jgi:alkyldihydroxyacetonephosphate synthase
MSATGGPRADRDALPRVDRDALHRDLDAALGEGVAERLADGTARVRARTHADVVAALRVASAHGARVHAPGAARAEGACHLRLDLSRLDAVSVDTTSRVVRAEGGATLARVESALGGKALTLGLDARVDRGLSVCGWVGLGLPGARDREDDPVDQAVCGLDVVLADGSPLSIRPAPRRAVGPDLIAAIVGARGRLGVVTAAHLVVRPASAAAPEATVTRAFRFASRAAAEAARAWMRGRGVRPCATRLVDGPEGSAFLVVRVGGASRVRDASLGVAHRVAAEHGGSVVRAFEVPDAPLDPVSPPSRVVLALADALDPAGLLG